MKDIRKLVDQPQTSVAERMQARQSVVSRLENQNDALRSTVSQYVETLGGQLKVMASFEDFEAPIEMPSQDAALPVR